MKILISTLRISRNTGYSNVGCCTLKSSSYAWAEKWNILVKYASAIWLFLTKLDFLLSVQISVNYVSVHKSKEESCKILCLQHRHRNRVNLVKIRQQVFWKAKAKQRKDKQYQGVKNFTLVARLGEKCNISCSSL